MGVPNNGDPHAVWVSTAKGQVVFKAWMPADIGFSLRNDWEDSFAQTLQEKLNGGLMGTLTQGVSATVGYTPRSQALSALLWRGSSSTEFQLPCKIFANNSVRDEIITPLKNLIAVSLPTKTQGGPDSLLETVKNISNWTDAGSAIAQAAKSPRWFKAPSTPLSRASGEERLDLYIGNFMHVPDIVVQDIQFTMPNRLHKSGAPVSCEIVLTVLTGETPSAEDAINWFIDGQVSDPQASQSNFQSIIDGLRPPSTGGRP